MKRLYNYINESLLDLDDNSNVIDDKTLYVNYLIDILKNIEMNAKSINIGHTAINFVFNKMKINEFKLIVNDIVEKISSAGFELIDNEEGIQAINDNYIIDYFDYEFCKKISKYNTFRFNLDFIHGKKHGKINYCSVSFSCLKHNIVKQIKQVLKK